MVPNLPSFIKLYLAYSTSLYHYLFCSWRCV